LTTNQRNLMIISTRLASGGGNFKHSAEWHQITPNSERVGKWPYILKLMNIRTPFLDEKWTFGDAANEINHGNYYRKAPVITPKPLAFLAEIMAAIVWTYIWFNFFTTGVGHCVHGHWTDPFEFTNAELGIPDDVEFDHKTSIMDGLKKKFSG